MSAISLTANVYFIGPVTPLRGEDATNFYFPCVALDELEEDGQEIDIITKCWFIVEEGFTEEELNQLKWGDRLVINAEVNECGIANSMFQERNGWHVTTIELVSRGNTTFEDTDIPLPLNIDLPTRENRRQRIRKKLRALLR